MVITKVLSVKLRWNLRLMRFVDSGGAFPITDELNQKGSLQPFSTPWKHGGRERVHWERIG